MGCGDGICDLDVHSVLRSTSTKHDTCGYNAWFYRMQKRWRQESDTRESNDVRATMRIGIFDGTAYHCRAAKAGKVTHPVLCTCSLASFPTRVFATLLFCKNPRWVQIIILFLHLESMTFVRRWFFINPGREVRTIETMMWSSSLPWKESTLNTVFSQVSFASFKAFSIMLRWAS